MFIASLEIDAQKTFTPLCPSELPVPDGHLIVPELNEQADLAHFRIMTLDAHSLSASWISSPEQMGQPTGLKNADRTWVAHAIIGSTGYERLDGLPHRDAYDFCVWKGIDLDLHPYGACFHDLEERLSTGLLEWLNIRQVSTVLVGGLATDFCVQSTVCQLLKYGHFRVIVNQSACRGIFPDGVKSAWEKMSHHGAICLENSRAIKEFLTGV